MVAILIIGNSIEPQVEKIIVRKMKKKPNKSSTQLQDDLAQKGYDVTDRTIRRIRIDLGYNKVKSSLLPNLSEGNIKSRLDYCVKHITDKFSNAVFTDESNFQLAANNQVLWYRRDEEDKPHLTKPRNNKKIMIWGGISRKGQTPLYIYRLGEGEKVTAESYVECIEDSLIDVMDRKFGKNKWRLLQDNARPHAAQYTQEFIEENNIRLIVHPPYSPDLNPIEKVWAWMKSDIVQTTYDNVELLIKVVQKKWNSMTIKYQNDLIDHHMDVVKKVHDAGGVYV